MKDGKNATVAQEARRDHAQWLAEHRRWAEDAERWLRAIEAQQDVIAAVLGREHDRIMAHVSEIRRHEAEIASHDLDLAIAEVGTCGGCETVRTHEAAAEGHSREATRHDRFAERQRRVRETLEGLCGWLDRGTDAAGG